MIQLTNVNKTYNNGAPLHVLKGINLNIEQGEFVSIMGASGSGKSTLLNILGILDNYDTGDYYLNNVLIKNLSETKAAEYRNRMIGFIFQSFNLIPELNVEQNITFPLLLDYKKPNQKFVNELLQVLGLSERRKHLPSQLSGGQQQRVAIGRALVTRPALIMADEPTGNLDSKNSQEVLALLQTMSDRYQQTILMITHNKNHASAADRVFRMSDGVLKDLGVSSS